MINEKQIHYLLTIAEEANITRAAKKLYISQPALSRLILDLEQGLATPLFVRNQGGLYPTQAGEIYLRGCREALAVYRSVSKEISDLMDNRKGKITLGVTSLTGEFLLPYLLDCFEREFPLVELALLEDRMTVLQEMVKTGKADMALVYQTGDPELEYHLFLDNPIYLQVPPAFLEGRAPWKPGTGNPPILPEDLSGQPMILLKKGRGMRAAADHFLTQFEIRPGKIIETENIHLASSLTRLNKGFTFVPSIAVFEYLKRENSDFYCEIKDYPMKRPLYYCYRKQRYLTEAERFLIGLAPEIGES